MSVGLTAYNALEIVNQKALELSNKIRHLKNSSVYKQSREDSVCEASTAIFGFGPLVPALFSFLGGTLFSVVDRRFFPIPTVLVPAAAGLVSGAVFAVRHLMYAQAHKREIASISRSQPIYKSEKFLPSIWNLSKNSNNKALKEVIASFCLDPMYRDVRQRSWSAVPKELKEIMNKVSR